MTERKNPTSSENPTSRDIYLPSNVSLHFLLAPHQNPGDLGDLENLKRTVRETDILALEELIWDEKKLTEFNRISKGDSKRYLSYKEKIQGELYGRWWLGIASVIFNSRVEVIFADLGEKNDLSKKIMKNSDPPSDKDFFGEDIEKAFLWVENYFKESISLQKQREQAILGDMGPNLDRVITSNPKLREKTPVNVLIIFGSGHRNIADILVEVSKLQRKETGSEYPQVTVEESETALTFNAEAALKQHYNGTAPLEPKTLRETQLIMLTHQLVPAVIIGQHGRIDINETEAVVEKLTAEEMTCIFDKLNMERKYGTVSNELKNQYKKVLEKINNLLAELRK